MVDHTPASGLSTAAARERLATCGPNQLPEPAVPGPIAIFLGQFRSPFIAILLIAAAVSLAIGQISSAVFIFAVLLINAGIGTIQEVSAQRSASALRNLVRGHATVRRDDRTQTIPIEEVVPGDRVLLASGDRATASTMRRPCAARMRASPWASRARMWRRRPPT